MSQIYNNFRAMKCFSSFIVKLNFILDLEKLKLSSIFKNYNRGNVVYYTSGSKIKNFKWNASSNMVNTFIAIKISEDT